MQNPRLRLTTHHHLLSWLRPPNNPHTNLTTATDPTKVAAAAEVWVENEPSAVSAGKATACR